MSSLKEVTMTHEEHSPEHLHKLAEEVVKLILENEELTEQLGSIVIAKQTCPKGHECDSGFKCSVPFNCPKVHSIVKSAL
jgi:hypothetical protein